MLRCLRIAVTALCLTACVLLIALWVRTLFAQDIISGPIGSGRTLVIGSVNGTLGVRLANGDSFE